MLLAVAFWTWIVAGIVRRHIDPADSQSSGLQREAVEQIDLDLHRDNDLAAADGSVPAP